ncbi:hypothetical protein ACJX0J_019677, partial [Zea mays]
HVKFVLIWLPLTTVIGLPSLICSGLNYNGWNFKDVLPYTVSQPRKSTFLYSHMLNSDLIFSVDIIRDSATAGFGLFDNCLLFDHFFAFLLMHNFIIFSPLLDLLKCLTLSIISSTTCLYVFLLSSPCQKNPRSFLVLQSNKPHFCGN